MRTNPRSTVRIGDHPVHPMLVPFVIAFYSAAFAADIGYDASQHPFFARAAFWLIGAGIVASAAAGTLGLIDFLSDAAIRRLSAAWWHLGANVALSLVSILDWILRYRVGADAGSSAYIWLSLLAFLLLLFSGWKGGEMVYRHRVGVSDPRLDFAKTPAGIISGE
ncbi:MAG: DUF2231 domain-containing protein [Alphaproteobacteria bacterium]|nr:DUF2231 domain-containing protein [Alphaproteobacteria bacterium]